MKYVYIHGLYSNATSRKYLLLKQHFPDLVWEVLEWRIEDDLHSIVKQFNQQYSDQNLTIIGDSAGANLALQIKLLREPSLLDTKLLLLNPLLDFKYRISNFPFPQQIIHYFQSFSTQDLNNTTFLLSLNDELIDHTWLKAHIELHQFRVDDDHRLSNFKDYILKLYNRKNELSSLKNQIDKNISVLRSKRTSAHHH